MQDNDDAPTGTQPHPDFGKIKPRERDGSGPYGFGRPAHKPNPNASYSFTPENRTLPLGKRKPGA